MEVLGFRWVALESLFQLEECLSLVFDFLAIIVNLFILGGEGRSSLNEDDSMSKDLSLNIDSAVFLCGERGL